MPVSASAQHLPEGCGSRMGRPVYPRCWHVLGTGAHKPWPPMHTHPCLPRTNALTSHAGVSAADYLSHTTGEPNEELLTVLGIFRWVGRPAGRKAGRQAAVPAAWEAWVHSLCSLSSCESGPGGRAAAGRTVHR